MATANSGFKRFNRIGWIVVMLVGEIWDELVSLGLESGSLLFMEINRRYKVC